MSKSPLIYNKSCLIKLPLLCIVTGIFTGALIFAFKYAASFLINLSNQIYSFARQNPLFILPIAAGFSLLGLLLALLLKYAPDCKGGGIPTSIAILRGLISFSWVKSIFCLFAGAMMTYLGGVPLGNEGPSVQMGTAVGKGTLKLLSPKRRAWDRYLMTGGACAGFACATGAPISGILFSYEEAHRRFSPLIFTVASVTVISGVYTTKLLCQLSGMHFLLFELPEMPVMPLRLIWCAALVGLVSGLSAAGFLKLYKKIRIFISTHLESFPSP
jgi:H+/Cl- antiporter ClcA